VKVKWVYVVVLVSVFVVAQDEVKETSNVRVGLTASLTNPHLDIILPIYFGNTFSIAPAFGFASVEDIGSDVSLGFVMRSYQVKSSISKYVGLGLAMMKSKSDVDSVFPTSYETQTDLLVSPQVGVEKNFDSSFAIGISAQVNIVKPDKNSFRLGYPDKLLINTGTSLYATLFF